MPKFSLLTLNSYGIPFYLGYSRVKRLANELNRLAPAVICLQEVQQNAYPAVLREGLPGYSNFTFVDNVYAPKGGLFTASSPDCTIRHSEFLPFSNRGRLVSVGFSDWALEKGVLLLDFDYCGQRIIVLNTHLHANYFGDWRISNNHTRIQLDQVNHLIEIVQSQPRDAWLIVCGDFNYPRHSLLYERMMAESGLTDALVDDLRPTYVGFPLIPKIDKLRLTLDYIYYRLPVEDALDVEADILSIEDSSAKRPLQRFITDHQALTIAIS
jgi:endonuclease/exonuclease/phosphatase family metal-dependent hydrolase